jgi:Eco29kI restriction endonuclease
MPDPSTFNPLDKRNLAESIAKALLRQEPSPLPPPRFDGAGIYLLYYKGDFAAYTSLRRINARSDIWPIYVGKAVPAGTRKGAKGLEVEPGCALYNRLAQHAVKIASATTTLALRDFTCRWLNVDEVFIRLGETLLISHYRPVWNVVVEGFGNKPEGIGRHQGKRPAWDILHPGRTAAEKLRVTRSVEDILARIARHFKDYPPHTQGIEVVEDSTADGWIFLSDFDAREMASSTTAAFDRDERFVCRSSAAVRSTRTTAVEESLTDLFAFKHRLGEQLSAVPHVVEDEPVVCAWYPTAGQVVLWNLSEQAKRPTLLYGTRQRTVPLRHLQATSVDMNG